jgi:hypothetical protein
VPVGVVAGQPGDLQALYDPGAAHTHLGDRPLEAFPVGVAGAGLALVGVDGDDRLGGPAQRDRVLPQRVLAGGRFGSRIHGRTPQRGPHSSLGRVTNRRVRDWKVHSSTRPASVFDFTPALSS